MYCHLFLNNFVQFRLSLLLYWLHRLTRFQIAVQPAEPISTNCISITAKQWRELCDVLEIEHALVQLSKD